MQHLSVHLVQTVLHWEDVDRNLEMFSEKLAGLDASPDLVVLPETFTTGFTQEPHGVAEPMEGKSMQWMQEKASSGQFVLCGSIVIREKDKFHNRFIWMPPDGNYAWYDKRHLFTFAGENKHYSPGQKRLVVKLNGWKIAPLICYDLRFPIWNRNTYTEEEGFGYDCMINVANWPAPRSHVWRILLMARALENQAYVIGLNRIGVDNNKIIYSGDSAVISPKGDNLSTMQPGQDTSETVVLPRCELDAFRDKFRVWADWHMER